MAVTIEAIEELINVRQRKLVFPAALEQQFEADTETRRCARLKLGILVSAGLYNLFLISDWLLIQDVFQQSVLLHLCVVTPWMLAAAWIMTRRPDPRLREYIAASVPLLIVLQIDSGLAVTTSSDAAHYQYVIIPTLLYINVALHRLVFPFARFVTITAIVCHALVVLFASSISTPVAVMIILQMVICGYITLIANYTLERDMRRAYLFSLRDRLRHMQADAASRRDALTSLGNRHHLEVELRTMWLEKGAIVSILMIDIDHFKRLNDRYGHGSGDLCLKRVAAILTEQLSDTSGIAIRFGGEEFLILLKGVHFADAMRFAERARRAVEAAGIPNEDAPLGAVTASFGVATTAVCDLSSAELIAAADAALYAAKRSGRNQIWPPLAVARAERNVEPILIGSRAS